MEQNPAGDMPVDAQVSAGVSAPPDDSLIDEIRHIVDDGRTYLEAELQYQKSRAALVFDRSRSGAIYGLVAAVLAHLALVALVVGLVIALSPLITTWGAIGVVAGLLLVAAAVFALRARRRFGSIAVATAEKPS